MITITNYYIDFRYHINDYELFASNLNVNGYIFIFILKKGEGKASGLWKTSVGTLLTSYPMPPLHQNLYIQNRWNKNPHGGTILIPCCCKANLYWGSPLKLQAKWAEQNTGTSSNQKELMLDTTKLAKEFAHWFPSIYMKNFKVEIV